MFIEKNASMILFMHILFQVYMHEWKLACLWWKIKQICEGDKGNEKL